MSFSFKTLLVPVDFSINTEVAVQKAMEIADGDGAAVHLLHIHNYAQNSLKVSGGPYDEKPIVWVDEQKARQLLLNLKKHITQALPHLTVQHWLLPDSSVQHCIEKMAEQLDADVMVIGKKSNHSWFPFLNTIIPNELAEATGRAVLTVKPGSLHNSIRTLVVPVSNNIPKQKMDALLALGKKTRIKVHLVTFINGNHAPANFSASALLQVYQWLKNSMHCPVEYAVLHGNNKAKAMLAYAQKTNADMLLVNPTSETKIGWMNRHISDVLSPDSKVQVLTVHP
jgi:nucleotide-binding universal stress UspA family protein